MFCCLTASTSRTLPCMADAELGIQVIVEAVVACRRMTFTSMNDMTSLSCSFITGI